MSSYCARAAVLLGLMMVLPMRQQLVEAAPRSTAITCRSLAQDTGRPHWLSLPHSRLVVNPHIEAPPPSPGFSAPELALNLAYYAGETPVALPGFWSWQPQSAGRPVAPPLAGTRLDFSAASAPQWQASGVTAQFEGSRALLTLANPYGSVTREVTVDVDETPFLVIQVAGGSGGWALKVNDGQQAVDTPLVKDTSQSGTFAADVGAATGWHGKKSFKVVLFAVGGAGKTLEVSRLQFFGRPAASRLVSAGSTWFPQQIVTQAAAATTSANETLQIHSTTALLDEATIAQRLQVRRAGGLSLLLTGQFSGHIRWDAARHLLVLRGEKFSARVSLSRRVRWLGVRASGLDWMTGEGPANATCGVWAMALDGLHSGEEIVIAARFTPRLSGKASDTSIKMADPVRFVAALRQQETAWNRRLQAVPHPMDFTPRAVDSLGVTASDVRRTYYTAWVFLFSNILPPLPENKFFFPQFACGKPSLWSEGAPGARASAQWESFLAMQSMALVDPDAAWAAFEGMMSLVGRDGSLNGEGLPSCHAQTAWVLYQATGDIARLRRQYPALKRLLQWKADNPRWILHGSTPPDMKDQEFVVRALLDLQYARSIASALQMPDEAALWQTRRQSLAIDFHRWFWQTPDSPPFRLYLTSTGVRQGPNAAWNLQGLALPPDVLQPWARRSLMKSFGAQFNRAVPFLVGNLSRFPNYELVWRGLRQGGDMVEAEAMADAAMRDLTRAGDFAEVYDQNAAPPRPAGVWPSVFGARHIIDSVLWHNGVVVDEGLPLLLKASKSSVRGRGVANLRVRRKPIRIVFGADQQIVVEGKALRHLLPPGGLRTVRSLDGPVRWHGSLQTDAALQTIAKR